MKGMRKERKLSFLFQRFLKATYAFPDFIYKPHWF